MRNLILLSGIFLFFISCKKENTTPIVQDCTTFLTPLPTQQLEIDCPNPTLIQSDLFLSYPVFNPINPNEISFLTRRNENNEPWKLWRHNICTNNHKVIAENVYYSQLDWNPLNWILYPNKDDNNALYKVRGNDIVGEKIVPDTRPKTIKWHPDGSKFLMTNNFDRIFIFDEDGTKTSTIQDIDAEALDWKEDQVALCIYPDIKILDLQSLEFTQVEYDNESIMYSVHFFKENYIYWNTAKTIAYTNITTQEKTIIKEAKPNELFFHFDISTDEKTIILHKYDDTVIDNCTISTENYFVLMDIDGTNERRILISE